MVARRGGLRGSAGALAAALALVAAAICGCARGRAAAEVRSPVGETTASGAPLVGVGGGGGESDDVGVAITEPVRRACQLPNMPHTAPRFDVDAAQLRPRGEDLLEAVAECVTAGPLAGKKILLVGYTDPRGSQAYNLQLGLYRAHAAKNHLIELGLREDAVEVESRGEHQAKGNDEAGWALDRRVEVHLARKASIDPALRPDEHVD